LGRRASGVGFKDRLDFGRRRWQTKYLPREVYSGKDSLNWNRISMRRRRRKELEEEVVIK
jgi:hypothetical protein